MSTQKSATPHKQLIDELLNHNTPKSEREHAAVREIERLRTELKMAKHDHDWQYIRDWYGDPNVTNGTADCNFLRCRICGDEDHESDPREYLYDPRTDE